MSMTLPQKLLEVQKKIAPLTKDSNNPFFKSRFTSLSQILNMAKEALHPHGLFLTQGPGVSCDGKYIETSIVDADSGQSITCRVPFSGNEKNMQEIGAATTYGRRFGIVSLLALEQEDDDGNEASGRKVDQAERKVDTKTAPKTASQEPRSALVVKSDSVGGSVIQPGASVSTGAFNREACLKKITLTSKVLVDSKRITQEEAFNMLKMYNVDSKDKLTDDQAKKLLSQYEEKLK